MRNMSFFLTTPQFIARTKIVTRRFGWWFLAADDRVMGCEKCRGIPKDGTINRLGEIEIVSAYQERADAILSYQIPEAECALEGFPDMPPHEFVEMICDANKKLPHETVNRIQFNYVDGPND